MWQSARTHTRLRIAYSGNAAMRDALVFDAQITDILQQHRSHSPPTDFDFALLCAGDAEAEDASMLSSALYSVDCQRDAPVVFWDLRRFVPCKATQLIDIARKCEHLFAVTAEQAEVYETVLKRPCVVLCDTFQPALHHPYRTSVELVESPSAQSMHEFLGSRQRQLLAWRGKLEAGILAGSLNTIAQRVNVDSGWSLYPPVTVFVPTYRIAFTNRVIANYKQQDYPNRDLVIVLHTNEDVAQLRRQILAEHSDIRIERLSTEHGVGACMNLALELATGTFSVKMDDDDYYGPNFLKDMILPNHAVYADVFGKPPYFLYIEESNQMFLRRVGLTSENRLARGTDLAAGRVRMSGATHSGRTEALRAIGFDERNLGAADTAFFERCGWYDVPVGVWDGFNIATYRSADPRQHTWQLGQRALLANASLVGDGRCQNVVMT